MLTPYPRLWDNELVPKTLVISLAMVICQVRLEDVEKRCLSNHDYLLECFLFDGTNESLAMGVEIRGKCTIGANSPDFMVVSNQ
jgi:hypothetical protein